MHLTPTERWDKWLDANKTWAAHQKHRTVFNESHITVWSRPTTTHTPESIYMVRDGQPVLAVDYTVVV